jgi:hypothetical protein
MPVASVNAKVSAAATVPAKSATPPVLTSIVPLPIPALIPLVALSVSVLLTTIVPWLRKFCGAIVKLPPLNAASMVPLLRTSFRALPLLVISALIPVWVTVSPVPSISVPGKSNADDTSRVPPRNSGVISSV